MSEITVIIPNYKGKKYLKNCLASLYAQVPDTVEFEILIVDNFSNDGSVEECQAYVEEQKALGCTWPVTGFLCLDSNTGFCHAVNAGIEASKSPYVLLLNNDTIVMPEFVQSLYRAIKKKPDIFSVSAKMLMWDNPELLDDAGDRYHVLGWAFGIGKGQPAVDYDRPGTIFAACGGAAIYRRSILEEIGVFDEQHFAYLEDLDLGYRAKIYGYRNLYEPAARVIHYGSASSGSRYNEWKTSLSSANNVYVIYKNMPLLQIIWNLPFLAAGFFIKWLFFVKKGMGKTYAKGLWTGFLRCFSREGRKHKVPFRKKHMRNYLRIQLELYANLIHFAKKT